MKILITGTTGYIGNHFERKLVGEGYLVDRISVRNSLWRNQSFKDYDVVIHTAALVHNNEPNASFSQYMWINTNLSKEIALKAQREGVKQFIFMSTMAVFGRDGQVGKDEEISKDTLPKPNSDYGISKLCAEEKLLELENDQFKVAIVRPPMIYGANCPGNFQRLFKISKILPILPQIYNQRSALYIYHLNEFIVRIIKSHSSGIFHPQDDFYFKTTNVMYEIRNTMGKKTTCIKMPTSLYPIIDQFKLFQKLFGNLTYNQDIDINSTNIEISQKSFPKVMKEIVHDFESKESNK